MTDSTRFLIVGAGMSGLAFANFLDSEDYLIVEREPEIGGWCKTIKQDGFVWDFSGHFFHFRHPDIEEYLRARMPPDEVVTVARDSRVFFDGELIDFPFQKNIHQLPKADFIECLYDLYFREEAAAGLDPDSFKGMLYEKFGRGIAERFLVPYNEKLYACDLELLDRDAMGRFFPHADLTDIVRNMREADNSSYNASFTYPRGGAIEYVRALTHDIPDDRILLESGVESIDLKRKVATLVGGREVSFEYLISSAPFDQLASMCHLDHDADAFSYNKVLVFNLGFDRKGHEGVHWIYYPSRDVSFYRIGFYDNIMGSDRMSLYVELGYAPDATYDVDEVRARVLADLERVGVVDGHELASHHSVTLDPAYVHITTRSRAEHARLGDLMGLRGVHSIGRYGGWTYCSIEDNIVEARALAQRFNALG